MLIEETVHNELPEVDVVIDVYSVIAKFLNGMKYDQPVLFPLPRTKFIEVQTKLHELQNGNKFYFDDKIKEFDATFEGRLFTFIKLKDADKQPN